MLTQLTDRAVHPIGLSQPSSARLNSLMNLPASAPSMSAVIEAQAEVLHRADRNGVVALGVGQHHRLLAQAADGQNRRLRLVDDRRAELLAEECRSW